MGGALDQNSVFQTQQDHCPQELTEQNLLKSKPGNTSVWKGILGPKPQLQSYRQLMDAESSQFSLRIWPLVDQSQSSGLRIWAASTGFRGL